MAQAIGPKNHRGSPPVISKSTHHPSISDPHAKIYDTNVILNITSGNYHIDAKAAVALNAFQPSCNVSQSDPLNVTQPETSGCVDAGTRPMCAANPY